MTDKILVIPSALKKQILLTLVPRRLTLAAFLLLMEVMRFGFNLQLSFVVDVVVLIWLASSFHFEWLIDDCKTSDRLAIIQFSYFILELLFLTVIVHTAGLTHWFGVMFYLYTIIYANILMSRNLARAITVAAIVFYSVLVMAEGYGLLKHYPPLGLPSSDLADPSLTGILNLLLILMAATTFISIGTTIKDFVGHLRKREEDIHFLSIKYKDAQAKKENLRKELMTTRMKTAIDGLTGLYNQTYFKHRLNVEFSMAMLHGTPLSVIFIDLDNFKRYNDTYGHQAGDDVLATYARLIKDSARAGDVVARYGGEEFTLLLPKTGLEEVLKVVERIRTEVRSETGFRSPLTFSAGISVFPIHGHSADELLNISDIALYHAKHQGKNQTVVAEIKNENSNLHE